MDDFLQADCPKSSLFNPKISHYASMKYLTLMMTLMLAPFFMYGVQSQSIAPLFKKLASASSDSAKVRLCYSISRLYWDKNADSVLLMSEKALALATRIHDEEGMALALLSKGVGYNYKDEDPESLNCYLQALRISEKTGNEGLTENLYNDIGIIYADMGNHHKARGYYLNALQIARKKGDRYETATLLINLAETFKNTGVYDSAIAYNKMALPIMEALKDSSTIAAILLNTGEDYDKKGSPERAMDYFRKCMVLSERIRDEENICWANIDIAQTYLQKNQCSLSIPYAMTALTKAKHSFFIQIVEKCYPVLYADYRHLKNFEKALDYRNLEIALKDSVYTIEKDTKIKALESGYELEKEQHQIDLLNKDKLIQQRDITGERQRHIMFAACALFFGMWAFFLFKSNEEKEKLNRQLKAQNQEILQQNEKLENASRALLN